MKRASVILVLSLSVFAMQGVHAQPFVCGQSMVETGVGTTKEEVLEKCGPPSAKDSDRWYYKNQPGQVTVVLTFETGKLEQIESIPE
ncbi:MAG: DUF2845 domain-containing protein [Gammaproteobacteria bacterium]|jgi:hypothetical protein|nr:DUF2845 domain-containing protein [Gammaproteobacteria bacterium]MDX2462355.1 DUF2845 domain-containing protein [Gammaproteobacteria bacterium]